MGVGWWGCGPGFQRYRPASSRRPEPGKLRTWIQDLDFLTFNVVEESA